MEWLDNLINKWYDKSENQKKAEEKEAISNSGKKIMGNFKAIAEDYHDIKDADIKAAAADFLASIDINIGKKK